MSSRLSKAKQEKVERDLLKNERALKLRVKALEDNEENLIGIIELRDTEIEDIKSDYRTLQTDCRKLETLDCRQCTNQEKLVKENKTMFRYLIAMTGITIASLLWAYITWSMR